MPNTLAHFAVQGVATRALVRDADIKWIFLGCVIPDIPWILSRATRAFLPGLDPYTLRTFAIVMATFGACLLLCAAIAVLTERPRFIFLILSLNSLLHLVLDAAQTKWGNGVHLFAPFSWDLVNFALFWPNSLPTHILTVLGLAYFLREWWKSPLGQAVPSWRPRQRLHVATVLFAAYVLTPMAFQAGPEAQDNHSIQTLRDRGSRPGRLVEFDRNLYIVRPDREVLRTFAREELIVTGKRLGHSGRISARGTFVDSRTIFLREVHEHSIVWWRSAASIVGLFLLVSMWLAPPLGRAGRRMVALYRARSAQKVARAHVRWPARST